MLKFTWRFFDMGWYTGLMVADTSRNRFKTVWRTNKRPCTFPTYKQERELRDEALALLYTPGGLSKRYDRKGREDREKGRAKRLKERLRGRARTLKNWG